MQFLVLTSDIAPVEWAEHEALLVDEAARVWQLIEEGRIRQIWFTRPAQDAVMLLEEASMAAAQATVQTLPLVRGGLIRCDVLELTAYTGLERLHRRP